jgi:phosphoribosylformylglycinamidine synthase
MKHRFEIVITLKEGLLDPQGKAVEQTVPAMGWTDVSRVRIGKHVDITIEAKSAKSARAQVEEIATRVLSNPVIEDFRIVAEEELPA